MVLPDQVTFSSLLNGDNDAVEEQMICDFESTIPKEEPRDEIDIITSENVNVAERYQNLNISLEKDGHGREKTDRGFNLNQIPSQSPLPEVIDTPMMLPQPITFSSLLNGDDLAAEERMLFELQSSFPELEEAMGGQVKLGSPITARAAEEEEEYDTTLTLSLREQIHNIASEHATDPQRKMSISLGKQPIVMQHWDDRPLKRTIEVGESSTAKHQKKDPPSGIIVANEVRNYNASNNTSRLMEVRNPIASNNTSRLMERRNYNLPIGTSEANQIPNSLYHPTYEATGLSADPYVRLMKALGYPERNMDWYFIFK
ncbi:unnamed protein product [Vicia faba]|uniref:Uncharacterized protein n=1 Tax=Vicia faba TaxID=3906 RepID=A0AAV0YJZ9_VICFA|nr:unnamed protein product [Vicia faba]